MGTSTASALLVSGDDRPLASQARDLAERALAGVTGGTVRLALAFVDRGLARAEFLAPLKQVLTEQRREIAARIGVLRGIMTEEGGNKAE